MSNRKLQAIGAIYRVEDDLYYSVAADPAFGSESGYDRETMLRSLAALYDADGVRLVASYEDPTIRNLIVDLNRYPELKRAFESGETVFIPDATTTNFSDTASPPTAAPIRRPLAIATW